jgi:hypothetical protein
MSTQHTPGPWTYGVRKDGSMWLSIGDHRTGPHFQADLCASEADAKLIVAAPEMLDALRRAVLALAFASESSAAMRDDYEAVSRAIAKATRGEAC